MPLSCTEFICSVLNYIGGLLNSSFGIALIGGTGGALFGALGAQHIAERSKRRDELTKEIRTTNAASMVAFSICSAALSLKKQHVHPMHTKYVEDCNVLDEFTKQQETGGSQNVGVHRFVADFRTFPTPVAPLETLKDLVFQKLSVHGRPLALVAVIEQSLVGLSKSIEKRDSLIQRFSSHVVPKDLLHLYYFGKPLPSGDIDQNYPDTVKAIHIYLDNLVFFTALLCDDLVAHGNRLHEAFIEQFKKGAPKVSAADFTEAREKGLILPFSEYKDWLKGIVESDREETV